MSRRTSCTLLSLFGALALVGCTEFDRGSPRRAVHRGTKNCAPGERCVANACTSAANTDLSAGDVQGDVGSDTSDDASDTTSITTTLADVTSPDDLGQTDMTTVGTDTTAPTDTDGPGDVTDTADTGSAPPMVRARASIGRRDVGGHRSDRRACGRCFVGVLRQAPTDTS